MLTEYPDVLTVPEVAKVLRISERSVYTLIQTKQFPGKKVGGSVRVMKLKLIDYLAKG